VARAIHTLLTVALLAACSGRGRVAEPGDPSTPSPAPTAPTATPAPADAATASYAVVLHHARATADRMCACADPTCVDEIEASRARYVDHLPDDPRATAEEKRAAAEINRQREACRTRLAVAAPVVVDDLEALLGPACAAYLAAFDRLIECDKLGPATDSMREARHAIRASLEQMADLSPTDRAAMIEAATPACTQAVEALRQTAAAFGCDL